MVIPSRGAHLQELGHLVGGLVEALRIQVVPHLDNLLAPDGRQFDSMGMRTQERTAK